MPVQLTVIRCVICSGSNCPSRQRWMAVSDKRRSKSRYHCIRIPAKERLQVLRRRIELPLLMARE
jgi:hypothetical protein